MRFSKDWINYLIDDSDDTSDFVPWDRTYESNKNRTDEFRVKLEHCKNKYEQYLNDMDIYNSRSIWKKIFNTEIIPIEPEIAIPNVSRDNLEMPESRDWISMRDNYKCQICGRRGANLHIHHIMPRSKSGTDDVENLISLCTGCHAEQESPGHKSVQKGAITKILKSTNKIKRSKSRKTHICDKCECEIFRAEYNYTFTGFDHWGRYVTNRYCEICIVLSTPEFRGLLTQK